MWHLDKKVPIGLALMILIQTVTLVYVGTAWKSDIDSRIVVLEKNAINIQKNADTNAVQDNRITVVETKFFDFQRSVDKMESTLETINNKLSNGAH